ncbi:MAG TPA: 3-phosphoshikimate 1-carboxyvinyltransferase [Vicinamibacterales bacterium]|nr:3-phosphoshikimate 1-carboxyvinyltransferase [Vicinamibacterales bacterium]
MRIEPAAVLDGVLSPPGDKSISHRYVMLSAIAGGTTTITNLAPGADVAATVDCMRMLGVSISAAGDRSVLVDGRGWSSLRKPHSVLDARNSGTTMRLLAGLVAGRDLEVTMSGDESLQRRPMRRVIDPLTAMGASISSEAGRAPLTIRGGGLHGVEWRPEVPSAQVKSAVMLAGLSASGESIVIEPQPTRDHSELAFPAFGLRCTVEGAAVRVPGSQEAVAPSGGRLVVPGDPSSAAVWCTAAAAVPGSHVVIENVCLNPRRLGFVAALRRMGADIRTEVTHGAGGELVGRIAVRHGDHTACSIGAAEVPDLIDELPVLAARAALGGSLDVTGASELRVKESDRITALVEGLRALGVDADERPDGFVVRGGRPRGGTATAAGDHRLVMAFAIVGLGSRDGVSIAGADAVSVSYPQFAADLARLRP